MVNLSVPPVAEASDELIEAFVEGTPVSVEDGAKFFDTNVQFVKSNPYEDYPNGVDYQSIMNEEAEVYFTNGQDFDTSVENIRTRSEELVAFGCRRIMCAACRAGASSAARQAFSHKSGK